MRKSGILLPIASLPSQYGIGCFSKDAYKFADFLEKSGQSFWQILPLGPTGFGDSPYQSFSAYAGNPYFIDLEALIENGVLTESECLAVDFGNREDVIDYEKLYVNRSKLLRLAYERTNVENDTGYKCFTEKNGFWLDEYALFTAIKEHFSGQEWMSWPDEIKYRTPEALVKYTELLDKEIGFVKFVQYLFYEQWDKLKKYANTKGISIIGDIPIYVSMDSVDVWSNPKLFQLDNKLVPIAVAGCPPDGFSAEGQLWGNPLYNWDFHKAEQFSWWVSRMRHTFELYDYVRIDHFRGFDEYYAIPYGNRNAVNGKWQKAPGEELFKTVKAKLGNKNVIAEDLGFITPGVKRLLANCGFCGIKVLQFAFDHRDIDSSNDHIPHNYPENCVVYTGTHDNHTLVSWFAAITDSERTSVRRYLGDFFTPDDKIYLPLLSLVMRSNANVCIIPLQDFLGKDDSARINTPSTLGDNWKWRVKKEEITKELSNSIYNLTKSVGRLTYKK